MINSTFMSTKNILLIYRAHKIQKLNLKYKFKIILQKDKFAKVSQQLHFPKHIKKFNNNNSS